jgi:hypothetical protein
MTITSQTQVHMYLYLCNQPPSHEVIFMLREVPVHVNCGPEFHAFVYSAKLS